MECCCDKVEVEWSIFIWFSILLVKGIFKCLCFFFVELWFFFILLGMSGKCRGVMGILLIGDGFIIEKLFFVKVDVVGECNLCKEFLIFFEVLWVFEIEKLILSSEMDVSKCGVLVMFDGWVKFWNGILLWFVVFLMLLSCSKLFVKLFLFFGVVEIGVIIEWLNFCMGCMLGMLVFNLFIVLFKLL